MANPPFPSHGKLGKSGALIGPLSDLLASGDLMDWQDNYPGDALDAIYPAGVTNGTSAAVTHSATGLTLVTGTTDNGYAGQGLSLSYNGDDGLLYEAIVTTPAAITTSKLEVGVTDATDDAGAVLVKATPTATAADYAVFVYDSDDDTSLAFHSAKAGTIVASEGLATLAVSTTYRLAVWVKGDNVRAYINGTQVAEHGGAAGIEGGTLLTPWVFAQARAGSASRTYTVRQQRVRAVAPGL